MECKSCGQELERDDLFCPACGTKVGQEENIDAATEASQATRIEEAQDEISIKEDSGIDMEEAFGEKGPKPSNEQAANNDSVKDRFASLTSKLDTESLLKDKKKLAIGGGALVAAAAIALVAFGFSGGGVSKSTVEEDLKTSDIMTSGVIHSDYVNESPYELVDFSVTGQEKIEDASFQEFTDTFIEEGLESRTVSYDGTIKNESFESDFTGTAIYVKYNDSWELFHDFETTSSTTTPLKGVDSIESNNMKNNQLKDDFTINVSDFESSLNNDNGTYTSSASQTITYDFWFANDTAKNTRDFTFDNEKGWVPSGDVNVSETKTEWKLANRTFTFKDTIESNIGSGSSVGDYDSTFSFKEAPENTLNAEYQMDFKGGTVNDRGKKGFVFHDFLLSGSLSAAPTHEFGSETFTVEFNDTDNDVTLICSPSDESLVAGAGTVDTLSVDMVTDKVYAELNDSPRILEAKRLQYTENVQ